MQSVKNTKNYYQVLGVLDEADDLVIRAAYIALMQRYDLAKWQGNKQIANRKLSELNDAYAVLSDRNERIDYDQTIAKEKNKYEPPKSEQVDITPDEADKDWKIACDYYQDLDVMHSNLQKISEQLAFTFKLSVLQSKDYSGRNQLAARLEHEYLKRYFGNDQDLIDFGKELILEGKKEAATELNEVFRVLGSAISANEVIDRIAGKFNTTRYIKQLEERELRRVELLAKNVNQDEVLASPVPEDEDSNGIFTFIAYSIGAVIIVMVLLFGYSAGFFTQKHVPATSAPTQSSTKVSTSPDDRDFFRNHGKVFNSGLLNSLLVAANGNDASQISQDLDALKLTHIPDVGNRQYSRELNSQGLTKFKNGDYRASVELFSRAYTQNESDPEVLNNLAYAQLKLGLISQAVDSLEKTLLLSPERAGAWFNLYEGLGINGGSDELICGSAALGLKFSRDRQKSIDFIRQRISSESNYFSISKLSKGLTCALSRNI